MQAGDHVTSTDRRPIVRIALWPFAAMWHTQQRQSEAARAMRRRQHKGPSNGVSARATTCLRSHTRRCQVCALNWDARHLHRVAEKASARDFPKVCLDLGVVAVYVEAPWLSRHVIEDLGQGFPTLFCEHSSTLIRRPMSTRTMMCPAVGVLQPSGMAM